MTLDRAERDQLFGQPGHVNKHLVTTPWGLTVWCHDIIAPAFLSACKDAAACSWKPHRIDSYNYRNIRGSTAVSMHAYALAWDFFATPPNVPPPGGVWTPDNPVTPEFAACFTRRGFRWGATFTRQDLPHIEWPGGRPTRAQEAPHPEDHIQEADMPLGRSIDDDRKANIYDLYVTHLGREPYASEYANWLPHYDTEGSLFVTQKIAASPEATAYRASLKNP